LYSVGVPHSHLPLAVLDFTLPQPHPPSTPLCFTHPPLLLPLPGITLPHSLTAHSLIPILYPRSWKSALHSPTSHPSSMHSPYTSLVCLITS
ncbi:hypothetical protein CLOP_g9632, partial [Closterium sp. NIES-67]